MARSALVGCVAGALTACLAIGCAKPAAPDQAAVAPEPAREAPDAAEPVAASGETEPIADQVEATVPEPAPTDVAADYEPPFPDRMELFVAPKRLGTVAGQDSSDNTVELMGFVRVDRQRAVLAINGEIKPMAEGDTQFGVEVISVQPPNVVLQRGRQRWQATLE